MPSHGLHEFPQRSLRLVLVMALGLAMGSGAVLARSPLTLGRFLLALTLLGGLAWGVSQWILLAIARQRQGDRQQAEAILHQRETNHQALISALPDLIMRVTGDGIYQEFIATSVFKVIGKTGDFVGTHVADSLPPELATRRMQAIRTALQTSQIQIYEQEILVDGAIQTEEVRVVVCGADEVLIIGRDITAQSQALAKLQQAKDSAEAANLAKSTFLATISHELRTPMNAILGFVQMLLSDRATSSAQRQQLEIINRNGEHLLALINDVLSLTKIEANRMMLEEECFDLPVLLRQVQESFDPRIQAKGLTLVWDYPQPGDSNTPLPQLIQGDQRKLRQVLINLVDNAIKFTPQGTITIGVGSQSDWTDPDYLLLTFTVEDTGLGIAPEEQTALFEPFVQTTTGRNSQQGSGLGLSICQRFVQLMGGTLTVESQPNQGSRFQFTVVVRRGAAGEGLREPLPQRALGLAPHQGSYRILIVDSLDETRQSLVELLHPLGFIVVVAEQGSDAIALWQSFAPHLVLLDLPIADGSAWELIQQIRSRESVQRKSEKPLTKIIALVAKVLEDPTSIAMAAPDTLIEKPYSDIQLLESIRQQLGAEYLYQPRVLEPSRPVLLNPSQMAADLRAMPLAWRQQLHAAAQAADEHTILGLIQDIPSAQSALISTLTALVDDFQLKQIIQAVGPTIL